MDTKLERLDVAIITLYPDSERAADNYDALRKALIAGGSAASRHVSDLISLATALDEGANPETTRLKIADLLQVLDVTEVTVADAPQIPEHRIRDFFEVVGDKAHPRSAWVRMQDGVLSPVRKGYLAELPYQAAPQALPEPLEDSKEPVEDSTVATETGATDVSSIGDEQPSVPELDAQSSPETQTPSPTDSER
jgi:hypothetical protein